MIAEAPQWWPRDALACYQDLIAYRLVGASACADRMTEALVSVAVASEARHRDLSADLDAAARLFCTLKPDTALYRNLTACLSRAGRSGRADDVVHAGRALDNHRLAARESVITHTVRMLASARTVLVHDYSSSVQGIVQGLGVDGPRQIVVTAGEPLGQGARVARLAASAGHDVTYIPDMSAARIIDRVDYFLTGVECFYGDGSLANTVGTLMLALLCREAGVPVVALAETLKCDLEHETVSDVELSATLLHQWPAIRPAGSNEWHTVPFVLDAVPAALAADYVTEHGRSKPGEVGALARAAWMH